MKRAVSESVIGSMILAHVSLRPIRTVLVFLTVLFAWAGNVLTYAQTSNKPPSVLLNGDNRQAEQYVRGGWMANDAFVGEVPEIILVTVDTNADSWANATGFGKKLDWFHMAFFRTAQAPVDWLDHMFKPRKGENRIIEVSRFRLGVFGKGVVDEKNRLAMAQTVDFDTDIELPNMQRRMKINLTTRDPTTLPGKDVTEQRDKSLRTAVEGQLIADVSTSVGVRIQDTPELFANAALSTSWKAGNWWLYPNQKVFWESEDGVGEISTFILDRWRNRWNTRLSTSIKWSKLDWNEDHQVGRQDEGFRWSEVFVFSHAQELLDETQLGRIVSGEDVARGWGVKLAVFGGFSIVDEYRAGVFYRCPLRKKWLYLLVSPDINWMRTNEWDHEWTLKCGVEMLCWGKKTR